MIRLKSAPTEWQKAVYMMGINHRRAWYRLCRDSSQGDGCQLAHVYADKQSGSFKELTVGMVNKVEKLNWPEVYAIRRESETKPIRIGDKFKGPSGRIHEVTDTLPGGKVCTICRERTVLLDWWHRDIIRLERVEVQIE